MLLSIDDPVVVNPDTLSNHAFVKVNSPPQSTNGRAPIKLMSIQLDITIKIPSSFVKCETAGTKMRGKNPNEAEINELYNKVLKEESP